MRNIGLLFAISLVALAVMGMGYAHWSQTLYINGTVTTGKLCVGIRDMGTNDPPNTKDPGKDKDVGVTISINVGDPKCYHNNTPYYEEIMYKIENAYPCYNSTGFFWIANCGSIPVNITNVSCTYNTTALEVTVSDITGQLDPCEVIDGTIDFHVKQEAEQNKTYIINCTVSAIQWNLAP